MHVTITRRAFADAIALAEHASAQKSPLQILTHLLLDASATDTRLTLVATDLEIAVETWIPATAVDDPGRVAVPTKLLKEIIRSMPNGDIVLATVGTSVRVSAGDLEYDLHGMDGDEFPMPDLRIPVLDAFTIPGDVLRAALMATSYAMSDDVARGTLCGVCLERSDATATFVATNTHRLATIAVEVTPTGSASWYTAILSRRLVTEILKLPVSTDPVTVAFTASSAIITLGTVTLRGRVMEGAYPAWRRITAAFAEEQRGTARLSVQELRTMVSRSEIVAKTENNKVVFAIMPPGMLETTELILTAQSADVGRVTERTQVKTRDMDHGMTFALNAAYVADALRAIGDGDVIMSLDHPLAPVLFIAPATPALLQLIMPMQVVTA